MGKKTETKKKEKEDPPPPKKGTGSWILLLVFVSAWMFALGVLVGRGTAPVRFDLDKMEKDLAELKQAVMDKEETKTGTDDASEDLTFYRTLKNKGRHEGLTIEPTRKKGPKPRTPAPEQPKPITSAPNKPKLSVTPKTALTKTDEEEKTPPPAKPEPPGKKTPAKPEKTTGVYTLQVTSVEDQKAADHHVAKLRKKGYPAYKTIGNIPGKGMYFRVRIGHYETRAEAAPMMKRLKEAKMEVWLVKE